MGGALSRDGGRRASAGVATQRLAEAPPRRHVTADARRAPPCRGASPRARRCLHKMPARRRRPAFPPQDGVHAGERHGPVAAQQAGRHGRAVGAAQHRVAAHGRGHRQHPPLLPRPLVGREAQAAARDAAPPAPRGGRGEAARAAASGAGPRSRRGHAGPCARRRRSAAPGGEPLGGRPGGCAPRSGRRAGPRTPGPVPARVCVTRVGGSGWFPRDARRVVPREGAERQPPSRPRGRVRGAASSGRRAWAGPPAGPGAVGASAALSPEMSSPSSRARKAEGDPAGMEPVPPPFPPGGAAHSPARSGVEATVSVRGVRGPGRAPRARSRRPARTSRRSGAVFPRPLPSLICSLARGLKLPASPPPRARPPRRDAEPAPGTTALPRAQGSGRSAGGRPSTEETGGRAGPDSRGRGRGRERWAAVK